MEQPDRTSTSPVAFQLWTICDAFAADPDRSLDRVKDAGFSAIELGPLPAGLEPARLAESLVRRGLAVLSIHAELPTVNSISRWADLAPRCRCPKLVWHGWPRDPRFNSTVGVRDVIADCNAAAALARDHGLALGLHNHWWEFESLDGDWPIRLLHKGLSPDVFWQLDVYWAQTAGANPADVVAELGPRLRSVHWKDGPCVHKEPMTALGWGVVDVPRILRSLAHPVDRVIELDECATDPLEAGSTSNRSPAACNTESSVKIATFNVNSVNARLPVLLRWLADSRPDVACLQELKTTQERFPADPVREAGYQAIWHGQKAWNGVAILARSGEPVEMGRGLAGDPEDVHSRYLEGAVSGVRVGCLYLPNGNPAPGPKFDYKLRWLERLAAHAAELVSLPEPVVLADHYNVIPDEIDVYNPKAWDGDALFRPESRWAFRRLLAQGWTDALRQLHPGERVYTFWDYTGGSWRRNAGLRIDHLLLNPVAARRLALAGVDREVRAWEKTSDHAPTWVELRNA